jgi:tRNA1(Val) A37 N6-methylase TrmN6
MTLSDNHNKTIETTLLRGRVRLLQPETGFHASLDTVFLAAAVAVKDGQALLDIGCGVGSAGLCVLARNGTLTLTGIDVQTQLVALARRNAALNGMEDRCCFFEGNILSEQDVPANAFDVVMMNPPYHEGGAHTPSPHAIKAAAHDEGVSGAELRDWIKYAHTKLKNGGILTLIHRADRLDDIIVALTQKGWFGSLVVLPLVPHAGKDARRVIIRARKERYALLRLKSGLVLHAEDGAYTEGAEVVLSEGAALSLE